MENKGFFIFYVLFCIYIVAILLYLGLRNLNEGKLTKEGDYFSKITICIIGLIPIVNVTIFGLQYLSKKKYGTFIPM